MGADFTEFQGTRLHNDWFRKKKRVKVEPMPADLTEFQGTRLNNDWFGKKSKSRTHAR